MSRVARPKVLIELCGGLGNQLFQFAAGSVLSQKLSGDLVVNCKNVIFAHDKEGIVKLLPNDVKKFNVKNSFFIKLNRKFSKEAHSTYREKKFRKDCDVYIETPDEKYPSKVLSLKAKNLYLKGYFQSHLIVDEFKKINTLNFLSQIPEIVTLINKIKLESPIVFHARRGDYLNLSKTFGILSTRYYENAYEICRKSPSDKILLFTDSEPVVSSEFSSSKLRNRIEIVKINPRIPAWHYMVAMSYADKIVNSNSTFSWWASAISSAEVIVAPSYYFREKSSEANNNLERLYPSWRAIEPVWTSEYD
jgi:hypothetical protein